MEVYRVYGGWDARALRAWGAVHGQGHAVRAAQGAAWAHKGGPRRVCHGLQAQLLASIEPVWQLA